MLLSVRSGIIFSLHPKNVSKLFKNYESFLERQWKNFLNFCTYVREFTHYQIHRMKEKFSKSKCIENCFYSREVSALSTVFKKLDQLAICEC